MYPRARSSHPAPLSLFANVQQLAYQYAHERERAARGRKSAIEGLRVSRGAEPQPAARTAAPRPRACDCERPAQRTPRFAWHAWHRMIYLFDLPNSLMAPIAPTKTM